MQVGLKGNPKKTPVGWGNPSKKSTTRKKEGPPQFWTMTQTHKLALKCSDLVARPGVSMGSSSMLWDQLPPHELWRESFSETCEPRAGD